MDGIRRSARRRSGAPRSRRSPASGTGETTSASSPTRGRRRAGRPAGPRTGRVSSARSQHGLVAGPAPGAVDRLHDLVRPDRRRRRRHGATPAPARARPHSRYRRRDRGGGAVLRARNGSRARSDNHGAVLAVAERELADDATAAASRLGKRRNGGSGSPAVSRSAGLAPPVEAPASQPLSSAPPVAAAAAAGNTVGRRRRRASRHPAASRPSATADAPNQPCTGASRSRATSTPIPRARSRAPTTRRKRRVPPESPAGPIIALPTSPGARSDTTPMAILPPAKPTARSLASSTDPTRSDAGHTTGAILRAWRNRTDADGAAPAGYSTG